VSVFNKIPAWFCPTMSYGSRKRGYDQGSSVRGEGVDLRLRCITSSASQTFRGLLVRTTDDGRRGECSAQCLPPFVAALFFTLRDSGVDNTVDLYAAKRDIRPESRFCLPHLHSTPPLWGVPVGISPSRLTRKK